MIKIRLIKLLSHAKKYVVLQVLFQWISLLAQVTIIFFLSGMIFALAEKREVSSGFCIPVIAFCIGIRVLMEWLNSRTSFKASVDVKRILRTKIYEKLLKLGSSYKEQVHTSEVVQLATEGVEQLEIYFGKYLSQFFYSLICPLTLFVILSFVNIKASAILLVCVPLIPLSIVVVMKIAKRLLKNYWGLYAELGDSFLENLQGLTTLKIYQADKKKAEDMDIESQKFRHVTMKVLTMQLNSTSVMDIMAYGGAAVGMIVTLLEYKLGNVNLQGALSIILLASEFFIPLRLLGSFFHVAMNGMAASDKIFELLDLPEPEEKALSIKENIESIRFEKLSFSYDGQRKILEGVNILCTKGINSFAGVSGSGKSTLAQIIMGKNKGYEGKVLIDFGSKQIELKNFSEASIMKNFVLVNHNSYVFKGTVRDNFLMAKPDATDEEMLSVLEKVNLLEFENVLDYPLLEAGSNLSGGQKQRLSLARALLLNPEVFVFDEATSNIDVESEEQIMKVISELSKDKIIILISHRLANLVNSKRICFLKDGKISESGSHEELMKNAGEYSKLYNTQKELEAITKNAFSHFSL